MGVCAAVAGIKGTVRPTIGGNVTSCHIGKRLYCTLATTVHSLQRSRSKIACDEYLGGTYHTHSFTIMAVWSVTPLGAPPEQTKACAGVTDQTGIVDTKGVKRPLISFKK